MDVTLIKTPWLAATNPVARAQRGMLVQMAVAVACVATLLVLAALGLSAANLYPRFLAEAEQRQRYGIDVWTNVCKQGSVRLPNSLVHCAKAHADAGMVVRRVALEDTLSAVLRSAEAGVSNLIGHINPISWVLHRCGTESTCHYVAWKSVDAFTSSLWIMTCAVACVAVGVFYCCWRWPIERIRHWMAVRQVAASKRTDDESAVQINTAPPVERPILDTQTALLQQHRHGTFLKK